ncbi:hypothetical protein KP509_20G052600 [Ceratopteris richardii]|uniref:Uncharacterized protein n=1 Tax=Ceratopteris richardii TaxID=49495 RepID=A0A8T2SJA7_CERRI|nr:hypothetical protein KP509_20G052600 [Ceratopteris richardii]
MYRPFCSGIFYYQVVPAMLQKIMLNSHPFVGLKIVPQIVEETNEKASMHSVTLKDSSRQIIRPRPIPHRSLSESSTMFMQPPSRQQRKLRATTSLPPEREAGLEVLDILLSKANSGSLTSHYIGSPPHRAGNPLIHDTRFHENRPCPSPVTSPMCDPSLYRVEDSAKSSPISSCGSDTFVRIEGFAPSSGESFQRIPTFA